MIGPDEALQLVLQHAQQLPPRAVSLTDACGLVLAEPIRADRDYPPFERAMMDGFAVRLADAGKDVVIVGELQAGQSSQRELRDGEAMEIMTGAPCPPGTQAVVPKEQARVVDDRVTLPSRIVPGQHIAVRGSECHEGQVVLRPGQTITPLGVAAAASFGIETLRVIPKPSVAVITTGEELAQPGTEPAAGQIRDSNGPMLEAGLLDLGARRIGRWHARDQLDSILAALHHASEYDVIVLTGGVSAGRYDFVPEALKQLRAEVVFHKVRQKPGKPLLFARNDSQLIFALPGNPLAAHLCFHRYVAPAFRQMSGKPPQVDPLWGYLASAITPKAGRTFFVTARVSREQDDGQWKIEPMAGVSSADIFTCCGANAYAEVPPGRQQLPPGTRLAFTWIGSTQLH